MLGINFKQLFSRITGSGETTPADPSKGKYSAPAFLSEMHRQSGYDREIDEGMSSGMRRLATINVTGLTDGELGKVIKGLRRESKDFNLCKQIQLAGFNTKGQRFIAVSGESHMFYQGSSSEYFTNRAKKATTGTAAQFVDYVAFPTQSSTDTYEPVNLGPYGTTGAPMLGVEAHKSAGKLRAGGLIQ